MTKTTTTLLFPPSEKMSKVLFNADESVLQQWEQMHRPPDTIPTSGPVYGGQTREKCSSPRAGLIVPPPPRGASSGTRRHSVISSSRDTVTSFPLKPNGSGGVERSPGGVLKHDKRRISEVWLGIATFLTCSDSAGQQVMRIVFFLLFFGLTLRGYAQNVHIFIPKNNIK